MKKGKQNKFKEREPSAYKREIKGLEVRETKKEPFIVLSFKDFDRNQGQSFEEWQEEKLLAQGKECVIGYFEDNIFQIVFLDKNHEFWETKKKNT